VSCSASETRSSPEMSLGSRVSRSLVSDWLSDVFALILSKNGVRTVERLLISSFPGMKRGRDEKGSFRDSCNLERYRLGNELMSFCL